MAHGEPWQWSKLAWPHAVARVHHIRTHARAYVRSRVRIKAHAIHTEFSHDACMSCRRVQVASHMLPHPSWCGCCAMCVSVCGAVRTATDSIARHCQHAAWPLRCSHRATRTVPVLGTGRLPPSQPHCTEWRLARRRTHFLLLVFVQDQYGSRP